MLRVFCLLLLLGTKEMAAPCRGVGAGGRVPSGWYGMLGHTATSKYYFSALVWRLGYRYVLLLALHTLVVCWVHS